MKAGFWDQIMDAITDAYAGDAQLIDGTSVRVRRRSATTKTNQIHILDETGTILGFVDKGYPQFD
jgi:hypothetical protein